MSAESALPATLGSVTWNDPDSRGLRVFYTTTDIAALCGVTRKTMRFWLEKHGWERDAVQLQIGEQYYPLYPDHLVPDIVRSHKYQRKRIAETGNKHVIKPIVPLDERRHRQ